MRRVIRSEVEGRRDKERERRHQRRYARRHGYFWLPCHLCGDEYGGHEAGGSLPLEGDASRCRGICPRCTAERQETAERHLRELGRSITSATSRWGGGCIEHRVGERPSGAPTDGLVIRV